MKTVQITSDAYLACLIHALSTEREEVMGLLLGENTQNATHICSVCMLRRSDKRSDRVEISPEQLTAAAIEAESLGVRLKKNIQVLGWYHSHPHITVWPSHVDVRTQSDYQTMSPDFIGLIFSCFNEENMKCSTKVICFQSNPTAENPNRYYRLPLHVLPTRDSIIHPVCVDTIVKLIGILSQEEHDTYTDHQKNCKDSLTRIHNGAVYVQSLSHVIQVLGGPLLQLINDQVKHNQLVMAKLTKQKEKLEKELEDFENKTGSHSSTISESDDNYLV